MYAYAIVMSEALNKMVTEGQIDRKTERQITSKFDWLPVGSLRLMAD